MASPDWDRSGRILFFCEGRAKRTASPLTPSLSPSEGERESGGAVGSAMASPWPFDDLSRRRRGMTAGDSPSPLRGGEGRGEGTAASDLSGFETLHFSVASRWGMAYTLRS